VFIVVLCVKIALDMSK